MVSIFIREPERWLRGRFISLLVTGFPLTDQFVIGHLRFRSKAAGEVDRGWERGCWWVLWLGCGGRSLEGVRRTAFGNGGMGFADWGRSSLPRWAMTQGTQVAPQSGWMDRYSFLTQEVRQSLHGIAMLGRCAKQGIAQLFDEIALGIGALRQGRRIRQVGQLMGQSLDVDRWASGCFPGRFFKHKTKH